jgi:protocatechuate 3,4-dioxygenase beta subunit
MTGTTSREPRPASDSALVLPRYLREPAERRTPVAFPEYRSTALRAPLRTPVDLPQRLTEVTGPVLGEDRVKPEDADLTLRMGGEAQGQRINVFGRVLDSDGRPVPDTLVEVWQANAAGRYRHVGDSWPAPLDPHFDGLGRVMTDSLGRYEFTTIKPGAYPWGNHHNAWRPAHIHFSLFGRAFTQRLVTQMYFPGDPLFWQDPIFNSIPPSARHRAISTFDLDRTEDNWALAFQWDIVLRGSDQTPFETDDDGDVA